MQQDVFTFLPQQCFSSLCSDNYLICLILASSPCLWISVHLILIIITYVIQLLTCSTVLI